MQQLGGALGIAVIGTVFFATAASSGLTSAFRGSLWIQAGVLVVTAALVALLPKRAREPSH
jgi:membrane protein implicated in regulation of membrane protease activity